MSILSNLAEAILPLTGTGGFGRSLTIDGSPVTAIFAPDAATVAGDLSGSVVERYRLECDATDLVVRPGQELDIDGLLWMVVAVDSALPGLTDAVLERFV